MWRSARHGVAYIVDVEAIRTPQVIGYITKYLTKSLSIGEKGVRQEQREGVVIGLNEEGKIVEERQTYAVELVSKARRIRYSRHFFPEKVSELRARLFAELEQEPLEQVSGETSSPETASETDQIDADKSVENKPQPVKRSSWSLVQCEEFTQDYQEYKRRCRNKQ